MGTCTTQDRPDNRRSLRDPLVRREHDPNATARSAEAVGSGVPAEVHGDAGATIQDASRMSEADGPELGHLRGGELEGDGRPSERSDGERKGPEHQVSPGDNRQGMPAPEAEGEVGWRLKEHARRREKEVSRARTEDPSTWRSCAHAPGCRLALPHSR
jgi:hypothetical protein